VTAPERVVTYLLSALEQSRRELDRRAGSLRAGPEFRGSTLSFSYLEVRSDNGPLRIEASSEMRALASVGTDLNELNFSTTVEVTQAGFHVVVMVWADLEQAMGTLSVGEHTFYEYRSDELTFDQAVTEAKTRTAAVTTLETYCAALGLIVV
jgi:seryl-tRNA synthetase